MDVKKGLAVLAVGVIGSEVLMYIYRRMFGDPPWSTWFGWLCSRRRTIHQGRVIFFPDKRPTCKDHYMTRHGCTNKKCLFAHQDTSFNQLMLCLKTARRTLDLCIFVLTSRELADIVIDLHHKGVAVRVITDSEQVDASGSQVGRFRAEGIQVRHDSTSYLMHHKYCLIDGLTLVNGSFNWTRQAVTGNHENVLVTDYPDIVKPYVEEFHRLWQLFDPTKQPHTVNGNGSRTNQKK